VDGYVHGLENENDQFMIDPLLLMENTFPRLDEVEQHYLSAKQEYSPNIEDDLLVTTIIPSLVIANAPHAFRSGINPSFKVFNFMIVSIVTSGPVIPLIAMLNISTWFDIVIRWTHKVPITKVAVVKVMMKDPSHHFRPDI
jgi:hypothetical protein